jgi:acetylornithine deacetylase/succinyl-diaminopimelate desuccinylase-like protein
VQPSLVEKLNKNIAAEREAMADLTARLIRVPTENPPGVRYEECLDVLLAALEEVGLNGRTIAIDGEDGCKAAAVASDFGEGSRAVVFHGHYDVVPASIDGQFVPRRQGETIFGRGSSDMKSGPWR